MKKNILVSILIIVAILVASWMIFMKKDSPVVDDNSNNNQEEVVVIVNGEEIPRFDFDTVKAQVAMQQGLDPANLDPEIESQINSEIIDSLIGQVLLRQKATELGLVVDQSKVDEQIQIVKSQFGSDQDFENALLNEGLTEAELRDRLSSGLITQAYLEQELNLSSIAASETEITMLYEQISNSGQAVPDIAEVREQLESMVIQQKQQELINGLIESLRAEAEIVILI